MLCGQSKKNSRSMPIKYFYKTPKKKINKNNRRLFTHKPVRPSGLSVCLTDRWHLMPVLIVPAPDTFKNKNIGGQQAFKLIIELITGLFKSGKPVSEWRAAQWRPSQYLSHRLERSPPGEHREQISRPHLKLINSPIFQFTPDVIRR